MERSRWAWTVALVVLAAALVAFNLPARTTSADATAQQAADPDGAQWASDAPPGCEPGQQLPDFDIECLNGTTFSLSAHRGRVVIINLWATWCAPCVSELPHFDRLQRERADDVAVLAVHSDFITDDVAEFLSHYDYDLPFAVDATGELIASLNGSTMLPQTVVIDPHGIVTYNQVRSVTFEALMQLVDEALQR